MNVVMLNVTATGSTGGVATSVCKALKLRGDDGMLLFGRGNGSESDVRITSPFECMTDAMLSRLTGYNGFFSQKATSNAIKIIEEQRPDIVHIHNIHGFYIHIFKFAEYLKRKNIPVVWTLHDEYLFTGRCGISNDCTEWMRGCTRCPHRNEYPASPIFDRAGVMLEKKKELFEDWDNVTFVTPSAWLCERAQKSFLGKHPFRVISNGVDVSVFHPGASPSVEDKKRVLLIAPNALNDHKGGKRLIEIAAESRFKDVEFVIIGATAQESKKYTYANVRVLERIHDKDEIAGYYRSSNVFVTLSKRETFSMTCAESLCCGTPVVGFEAGAPETVFVKPYAEFVPYGEIDALAQLIAERIAIPVKDCAKYGMQNFSVETMTEQYLRIYDNLV